MLQYVIRSVLILSTTAAFIPSASMADAIFCYPDPGPNLENYPVYYFGTEPPVSDPEGRTMFGNSTFRLDKQITRGGESWVVGPAYFRGDQQYHKGAPFNEFVFRESRLTCSYEDADLVAGTLTGEHRNTVATNIRERLVDPYSVRSAKLGTLTENSDTSGKADAALFIACAEFNSKNRMGGYTGTSRLAYVLREDGSLFKAVPEYQTDAVCANVAGEPFPELGQPD